MSRVLSEESGEVSSWMLSEESGEVSRVLSEESGEVSRVLSEEGGEVSSGEDESSPLFFSVNNDLNKITSADRVINNSFN